MNILLFQERDVAAGRLDRTMSLEELSQLIETNTSALQFQRAYGAQGSSQQMHGSSTGGKGPKGGKCPFLPTDAGADSPLEGDACPWPFLWTHDPKLALVSHPVKNGIAFVAMLGLLRVAWEYPKRSTAALLGSALIVPWIKPRAFHTKPPKR